LTFKISDRHNPNTGRQCFDGLPHVPGTAAFNANGQLIHFLNCAGLMMVAVIILTQYVVL
jgi:hypothetical protein